MRVCVCEIEDEKEGRLDATRLRFWRWGVAYRLTYLGICHQGCHNQKYYVDHLI
jgi:hypothetical protein